MITIHASCSIHDDDVYSLFLWAAAPVPSDSSVTQAFQTPDGTWWPLPVEHLEERFQRLFPTPLPHSSARELQTLYLASMPDAEPPFHPSFMARWAEGPSAPDDPLPAASMPTARLTPVNVWGLLVSKRFVLDVLAHLSVHDFPDGVTMGSSLQFWIEVVRWIKELVAREQVVPGLVQRLEGRRSEFCSVWQPLKTRAVMDDLHMLAAAMPLVCCAPMLNPPLRPSKPPTPRIPVPSRLSASPDAPPMPAASPPLPPPSAAREGAGNSAEDGDTDTDGALTSIAEAVLHHFVNDHVDFLVRHRLRHLSLVEPRPRRAIWSNFIASLVKERCPLTWVVSDPSIRKLQNAIEQWYPGPEDELWDTPTPPTQLVLRLVPVFGDEDTPTASQEADQEPSGQDPSVQDTGWQAVDQWQLEYWAREGVEPDTPVRPLPHLADSDDAVDRARLGFCLRRLARIAWFFPAIAPSLEHWPPFEATIRWDDAERLIWHQLESETTLEIPAWITESSVKPRLRLTAKPADTGRFTLESLIEFEWRVSVDDIELDEETFRTLVHQQMPLLRRGNRWVALDPTALDALRRVRNGHLSGLDRSFITGRIRDVASAVTEIEDHIDVDITLDPAPGADDGTFRRMWDVMRGDFQVDPVEPPRGLRTTLRPYQERGLSWLVLMRELSLGACLADDMGLGKTVQVIAFLQHQKEHGQLIRPSLVVCPTSVVENWAREVRRFAPKLTVRIHHGSSRLTGDALLHMLTADEPGRGHSPAQWHGASNTQSPDPHSPNSRRPDVLITSYGTAWRDADVLSQVPWQAVIADEAQQMKNPRAKQTRAVKSFRADHRIALTGTPIENRLEELWSIMDFLNPGYLGSAERFHREFAGPIERAGDPTASKRLQRHVRPFILRRLKTDETIAPELPEKREEKVYCRLTAEQASLYQATVDHMMRQIETATGMQRRGLVLATLNRLKQICNHPAQLLRENQADPERSGKLQTLIHRLGPVLDGEGKALIFTQYASMGRLLQSALSETFGDTVLFLHGSVPRAERERLIDRFQNSAGGPRLFVLSLRAGGVGINLTRATHVFHFDRWWNPAVESQATDRAFRIGQTEAVDVHTFICRGTLEERIEEMLEQKRQLAEDIIQAGEHWLTELSTDELLDIFSLEETAVRS